MKKKTRPAQQTVLTLETASAQADHLAAELEARLHRPVIQLLRPGSATTWLELYFDQEVEALLAQRALGRLPGILGSGLRGCAARDWQSFWRHHFHAHNVGERLRIVPVWENRTDRSRGRIRLVLDPGLSFGTGEHFTTRFCLESLDRLCRPPGKPASMLDVGTGSGLLALAAARLGVRKVVAYDNDPQCLIHARANLRRNGVLGRVKLGTHDLLQDPPPGVFDIVCANVYGRVLMDAAPALVRAVKRYLVLSGLREHELDGVAEAYQALGGREIVRDGDGQWGGLVLDWSPV
jgi:ribosomal protein L11 methyltransferase